MLKLWPKTKTSPKHPKHLPAQRPPPPLVCWLARVSGTKI